MRTIAAMAVLAVASACGSGGQSAECERYLQQTDEWSRQVQNWNDCLDQHNGYDEGCAEPDEDLQDYDGDGYTGLSGDDEVATKCAAI